MVVPPASINSAAAVASQQYGLLSGDALIVAFMQQHGLNTAAVELMTRQRLRESDPNDEVAGWLRAAAELAQRIQVTVPLTIPQGTTENLENASQAFTGAQ